MFGFDQTRVAINQIGEVTDTRSVSDEMVALSLAFVYLLKMVLRVKGLPNKYYIVVNKMANKQRYRSGHILIII